MSKFEEWKQDLLAREPQDKPSPNPFASTIKNLATIAKAPEDFAGSCTNCGANLTGMSTRDRAIHYLDETLEGYSPEFRERIKKIALEKLEQRFWPQGPPDSIGE